MAIGINDILVNKYTNII